MGWVRCAGHQGTGLWQASLRCKRVITFFVPCKPRIGGAVLHGCGGVGIHKPGFYSARFDDEILVIALEINRREGIAERRRATDGKNRRMSVPGSEE